MRDSVKPRNVCGRPSMYTPELAQDICDTISSTTKGLPTLCQIHDHWPSYNAIYEWIQQNRNGFGDMYAKAKESQADYLADDILRIIDKPETFIDEDGRERNDTQMIRLKVDALKWHAMKLKPKKWGDRTNVEVSDPQDTLTKIRDLVDNLNKTNTSDV